jgi:hypothetical protein
MAINLNDESYESSSIKIFNNGVAGVVENVTAEIKKKTAEDKEDSPEYTIIFTDSTGATTNTGFWFVKQDQDEEKNSKKQGKRYRDLLKAAYGQDYKIPEFADMTDALHQTMKLFRESLKSSPKFRIIVNYGSTQGIKKFIQPRSWAPFIESMSLAKTELSLGNIDATEPLREDTPQMNNSGNPSPNPNNPLDDDGWGDD